MKEFCVFVSFLKLVRSRAMLPIYFFFKQKAVDLPFNLFNFLLTVILLMHFFKPFKLIYQHLNFLFSATELIFTPIFYLS